MAYTTRKSLIERVCRGDNVSWKEFYDAYCGFITSVARWHSMQNKYSLSDLDYDDLIQHVMLVFFNKSKTFVYDPSKGKFHNYLAQITKNRLLEIYREKKRALEDPGRNQEVEDVSLGAGSFETIWNEESKKHLLRQCREILKLRMGEQSYQIFDLLVFQQRSVKEICAMFSITNNQVYLVKSRAVKFINEALQSEELNWGL